MIVLLLFNENIKLTVEGIRDKTQIRPELLVQVLYSLLESKILLSKEITENFQDHDIQMNHTIELTKNFTSKKIRINLNVPLRSIEQQDLECLNISIDKDRYLVIQAMIVRIMKQQQSLKHSLLMQEIIEKLSLRFKPEISLIKQCIGILIDKEYLKRDSNDKDILHYLA
ncbi:unnamed protein product [Rotaria sp. Silwood2]|nr:unnamed protein product [Rotaria sp. Silwood2]